MERKTRAGLLLTLILAASPLKANGFKAMAKELSSPAGSAGIRRVAVLPFIASNGVESQDGLNISEKLTTQVVRAGKVQAVERGMLGRIMEEHHLAQTGAIDPAAAKKLGRLLSIDGIITGTFSERNGQVFLNARLIDVETGVIVAASESRVERDWAPELRSSFVIHLPEPKPVRMNVPPLAPEEALDLRDAVAENSCADSGEAEVLESGILDLKARRWAALLKSGATRSSLNKNLDSTIADTELKLDFLERVDAWSAQGSPALTPSENDRVTALDQKAFWLLRNCSRTEVN